MFLAMGLFIFFSCAAEIQKMMTFVDMTPDEEKFYSGLSKYEKVDYLSIDKSKYTDADGNFDEEKYMNAKYRFRAKKDPEVRDLYRDWDDADESAEFYDNYNGDWNDKKAIEEYNKNYDYYRKKADKLEDEMDALIEKKIKEYKAADDRYRREQVKKRKEKEKKASVSGGY